MAAQPDYIRWYPGALALANSLLGAHGQAKERAKDIVQHAVAQLIERGEHLETHRQAWFFAVVRNACIDQLRQQQRYVPDDQHGQEASEESGPVEQLVAAQRQQQVKRALQRLTFEQREMLLLRDVNDLSYADIAQVLGINVGTVMSRLHRARMALRAVLHERMGSKPAPQHSAATHANPLPKEVL